MGNSVIDFILTNKGSTLTYSETYAIIYNDNSFKISAKEPREIYEAINHKKALDFVLSSVKSDDFMFNEAFIKNVNKIINQDIKDIEGYRKVQVFIKGSEHIPPEPNKINNLMQYYIYNYNNDLNDIFYKIAYYHLEFESIHPFEDGNGRTGRLLVNAELLRNNLAPIVIEKDDRAKYFELLRTKDIEGIKNWFYELNINETERMKRF